MPLFSPSPLTVHLHHHHHHHHHHHPLLPRTTTINCHRPTGGGAARRPTVEKANLTLTSSVASPPVSHWTLNRNHLLLLNITACAAAVSASWVFVSAIPTLLAFKRAAESLEKLLDVTAEELPDTMAAVRLSGMEISDLTMELSDLGQEIGQGVRSSTRAVRVAEDRLRRMTNTASTVTLQRHAAPRNETKGPVVAATARNVREGIVKGRATLGYILSIVQFSQKALDFLSARGRKH